jgi:hypothetical protein
MLMEVWEGAENFRHPAIDPGCTRLTGKPLSSGTQTNIRSEYDTAQEYRAGTVSFIHKLAVPSITYADLKKVTN